jgi:hypothetical protein
MKRLLFSLLILVMLTPSLACAGIMHVKKPEPCPMHMDQGKNTEVMFFKDCAKLDLLQSGGDVVLKQPDFSAPDYSFVPVTSPAWHDASGFGLSPVRGPPVTAAYPPVFLNTLRLRI